MGAEELRLLAEKLATPSKRAETYSMLQLTSCTKQQCHDARLEAYPD
jgi:hypothetical protein